MFTFRGSTQCLATVLPLLLLIVPWVRTVGSAQPTTKETRGTSPTLGASTGGIGKYQCYQCNSDTEGQFDCESNELDKLARFNQKCKIFNGTDAKSCRKVLQHVEGVTGNRYTVVRECAYTEEKMNGVRKTGNKGISVYLYQCANEQEATPCNSAQHFLPMGILPSLLTVLLAVLLLF